MGVFSFAEKFPPQVSGPDTLYAYLNIPFQFKLYATPGKSNDTLTFHLNENTTGYFTMTVNGNIATIDWLPTSTNDTFEAGIIVRGSDNLTTIYQPEIHLCACDNGGECINVTERDRQRGNGFRYLYITILNMIYIKYLITRFNTAREIRNVNIKICEYMYALSLVMLYHTLFLCRY